MNETTRPLDLYESMQALSQQMVAAAGAAEWQRLTELERECAGLARRLAGGADAIVLNDAEKARKRALILQILADDAEVRRHTEPWMQEVGKFLGANARQRQVNRAYRG